MVATTANSSFTKSVFLEQVATMESLPMEAKYHSHDRNNSLHLFSHKFKDQLAIESKLQGI